MIDLMPKGVVLSNTNPPKGTTHCVRCGDALDEDSLPIGNLKEWLCYDCLQNVTHSGNRVVLNRGRYYSG